MARLVLTPSPFVGAASWRAVADACPEAVVADYRPLEGPHWYETAAAQIAAQAGEGPWIGVLHSGAGAFAPAMAEGSPALAGLVFVDAVLPYPGKTCLENAPDGLADAMRRLNGPDGRLAPWNRWFPEDPLPRLIANAEQRAAFEADLPRTPFAFLAALSRPSNAWEAIPSAYLQLSRGYEETAARVAARGWRVGRLKLHHLAMASHPARVMAQIQALAAELT